MLGRTARAAAHASLLSQRKHCCVCLRRFDLLTNANCFSNLAVHGRPVHSVVTWQLMHRLQLRAGPRCTRACIGFLRIPSIASRGRRLRRRQSRLAWCDKRGGDQRERSWRLSSRSRTGRGFGKRGLVSLLCEHSRRKRLCCCDGNNGMRPERDEKWRCAVRLRVIAAVIAAAASSLCALSACASCIRCRLVLFPCV